MPIELIDTEFTEDERRALVMAGIYPNVTKDGAKYMRFPNGPLNAQTEAEFLNQCKYFNIDTNTWLPIPNKVLL